MTHSGDPNVFTNPACTATNAQPFYLLAREVGTSTGKPGGLITQGPLGRVVFGSGAPGTFNFGTVASVGNMDLEGEFVLHARDPPPLNIR